MTLKELYEALLTEVNKDSAPNITLEDFNYFANRAINQYINKRYNIYDINQQTTDDLRVLKASAILPVKATPYKNYLKEGNVTLDDEMDIEKLKKSFDFMEATYTVQLPDDYLHLLNCVCFYQVNAPHKCYNKGDVARARATRLTADSWGQVVDNFWNMPSYNKPYYYIHNVNSDVEVSTNTVNETTKYGTDKEGNNKTSTITEYTQQEKQPDPFKTIDISGFVKQTDTADSAYSQRKSQIRYGNASKVWLEIRYGQDDSVYKLFAILIDYIKAPQHLRLTQKQLDTTLDTSQVLEFPDYVCQEIVNELVNIVMENQSDARLQTHPVVSQSIANPTQQQTETA